MRRKAAVFVYKILFFHSSLIRVVRFGTRAVRTAGRRLFFGRLATDFHTSAGNINSFTIIGQAAVIPCRLNVYGYVIRL
ncbi:MAG: hypothetical protein CVU88_04440 [Firmicutes bacterium HGW-Firmicutes-13]|nr:MAG: hypothetical protein CVU88_04440 [Firmicutes bacterium HGW-Firmicutes-13]